MILMFEPKITKMAHDNKNHEVFHAENLVVFDRNLLFLKDKKFAEVYKKTYEDSAEKNRFWRVHVFLWAFINGLKLDGDLIECGVYRGFSSAVATRYTDFGKINKTLYLFDTWEGIPQEQLDKNRIQSNLSKYEDPSNLKKVEERFKDLQNVKIVKGKVPDIFHETEMPENVSFLHLDLNTSSGEIGALEFLFDKMVSGSVCLLDDYGHKIAAIQAVEEYGWFKRREYFICELPTGQAIIVKT